MDPRAGISFGYAPNNFVVPAVTDGQIEPDVRQKRFHEVLVEVLSAV